MSEYIDAYIGDMLPLLRPTWERFYGPDSGCEEEFLAIMESHRAFFAHRREAVEAWEFGV